MLKRHEDSVRILGMLGNGFYMMDFYERKMPGAYGEMASRQRNDNMSGFCRPCLV